MADPAQIARAELPKAIRAPEQYVPVDGLFVISTYYNPQGFQTRKDNVAGFIRKLQRSRMNWIVIECAFQEQAFHLPASENVLHVRGEDVMCRRRGSSTLRSRSFPTIAPRSPGLTTTSSSMTLLGGPTSEILDDYVVVHRSNTRSCFRKSTGLRRGR